MCAVPISRGGETDAQRAYIACPETRLQGKTLDSHQELDLLGVNLRYSVGVNRSVGGHAGESLVDGSSLKNA